MKWIWVRHGETDMNKRGCYLGHYDTSLNATGVEQIARLRERSWELTKVYSSDLLRCKQTAEILVGAFEVSWTSALRELNFGAWEGKRYEEIMRVDAKSMTAWYEDPFSIAPPYGETLQVLGNRVDAWLLDTLKALSEDDVVLVVSHGGPIRWLLSRWLLGDAKRFWDVQGVPHGGGLTVEWNGQHWGQPQFFQV